MLIQKSNLQHEQFLNEFKFTEFFEHVGWEIKSLNWKSLRWSPSSWQFLLIFSKLNLFTISTCLMTPNYCSPKWKFKHHLITRQNLSVKKEGEQVFITTKSGLPKNKINYFGYVNFIVYTIVSRFLNNEKGLRHFKLARFLWCKHKRHVMKICLDAWELHWNTIICQSCTCTAWKIW